MFSISLNVGSTTSTRMVVEATGRIAAAFFMVLPSAGGRRT